MSQSTCNESPHLWADIRQAIMLSEPKQKCVATQALYARSQHLNLVAPDELMPVTPGYPERLVLVSPGQLKRRGLTTQRGRNILIHAIAHIEYNAINLALDAAYRFQDMPLAFTQDWLQVAADEARHFQLLNDYLNDHDCEYGDYPAHNGLWDMAVKTDHDVLARMALVPRVLEARGLDVSPAMIERLNRVEDTRAADHLNTIYEDEIHHVAIGSYWFKHCCDERQLEPQATFFELVDEYMHGELRGPFNVAARLKSGFNISELDALTRRY